MFLKTKNLEAFVVIMAGPSPEEILRSGKNCLARMILYNPSSVDLNNPVLGSKISFGYMKPNRSVGNFFLVWILGQLKMNETPVEIRRSMKTVASAIEQTTEDRY